MRKNGSSRREPALISDISVGFTAKFEPSYLGDYSKNEFSDTLYGITLGYHRKRDLSLSPATILN